MLRKGKVKIYKSYYIFTEDGIKSDCLTCEKSPTVHEMIKLYYKNNLLNFWRNWFHTKILKVYIIAHCLIYVKP